jgi:hypothetical protein
VKPAAATAAPGSEAALKAEAAQFAAEEAARQAKAPSAAPTSSSGPGATPPPFDAAMTASVVVTLLDLVLAAFVSQKLKLSDAEAAAITAKAEPVIRMYLPPEMFVGPVGALALTAGGIYAAKLMAADAPPPASSETVDSTATQTPAGAPGVAT